ncbi:MAG TPA: outer membrane lipoprotein chaperone LolA [Woeseiaceae bacterium]
MRAKLPGCIYGYWPGALCALLLVVMLSPAGGAVARAAEPCAGDATALLERFVEDVVTMSGRFEQSLIDTDDQVVETSEGTFDIRRPGQFRWSYSTPYEQLLVADGLNVWSYDVDLAQVTVKPQSEVLPSTPALLLGGAKNVMDDFEIVDSFEDRGTDWVRLVPRDQESGFNRVELGFTDGVLTRMIFSDNLEQTTLVAMHDVTLNEAMDSSLFQFSPPEGVDVVGDPVTPDEKP